MTITERLQALLDGKALYATGCRPAKIIDEKIHFLNHCGEWFESEYVGWMLSSDIECRIYEEPKPVERPKFNVNYPTSWTIYDSKQALERVLDYIDAKIAELKKELRK